GGTADLDPPTAALKRAALCTSAGPFRPGMRGSRLRSRHDDICKLDARLHTFLELFDAFAWESEDRNLAEAAEHDISCRQRSAEQPAKTRPASWFHRGRDWHHWRGWQGWHHDGCKILRGLIHQIVSSVSKHAQLEQKRGTAETHVHQVGPQVRSD